MAEKETISNVYMAYIKNKPYIYPNDDIQILPADVVNTGYHILPNILWKHLVTPRQWIELVMKYEAYHVDSIKGTIFNCVPMTTQIAIQGTTTFTAFNNAIYGIAYKDDLYETSWFNYYTYDGKTPHNYLYKEGLSCQYGNTTKYRLVLPEYSWSVPNTRAQGYGTYNNQPTTEEYSGVFPATPTGNDQHRPTGIIWDPLNRPNEIMELRPGKNAINFSWECHPCDAGKWYNLDLYAWWYPYVPESPYHACRGRPGQFKYAPYTDPDKITNRWEHAPAVNDYTNPNYANIPIVPMAWWWKEMKQAVPATLKAQEWQLEYMDLMFSGTEYEMYKYGPTQWFCKMIPLFDENGTHIECSANISVKMELNLTCKKRRSAIFAPTWGPFNWKQLYCAKSSDQTYNLNLIRYRTGGARRTWQNLADSSAGRAHARTTPFDIGHKNPSGSGDGGTRFAPYPVPKQRHSPKPSAPPIPLQYPSIQHITGNP